MKIEGFKEKGKKPRYNLLTSTDMLEAITEVREFGIDKYTKLTGRDATDSWIMVPKEEFLSAAFRHTLKRLVNQEELDNESNLDHLAHAACNIMFFLTIKKLESTEEGRNKLKELQEKFLTNSSK